MYTDRDDLKKWTAFFKSSMPVYNVSLQSTMTINQQNFLVGNMFGEFMLCRHCESGQTTSSTELLLMKKYEEGSVLLSSWFAGIAWVVKQLLNRAVCEESSVMLVMVCGCVHCGGGQTNSSTELFVRKKAERDVGYGLWALRGCSDKFLNRAVCGEESWAWCWLWFVGIARVQLPQQSCLWWRKLSVMLVLVCGHCEGAQTNSSTELFVVKKAQCIQIGTIWRSEPSLNRLCLYTLFPYKAPWQSISRVSLSATCAVSSCFVGIARVVRQLPQQSCF